MNTRQLLAMLAPQAGPPEALCACCCGRDAYAGKAVWVYTTDHDGDGYIFAVCEPCHDGWGVDWHQKLSDLTRKELRRWRKNKGRRRMIKAGKPQ
jgi:hypothetical protein